MVSIVCYGRVTEALKDGEVYAPALRTAPRAFPGGAKRSRGLEETGRNGKSLRGLGGAAFY